MERVLLLVILYVGMMIYAKLSGGSLQDLWPLGVVAGIFALFQLIAMFAFSDKKKKEEGE